MDYHNLYNTNADFKRYVDRYAAKHNEGNPVSKDAALDHVIVQNVGNAYVEESKRIVVKEVIDCGC